MKDLKLSSYKKNPDYKLVWTVTDSYLLYKEELKELAWDKTTYIRLVKEVLWELAKCIIRERLMIKIPNRLGILGIWKRKNNKDYNKQRIDWKHYNETGKIIYHCNKHSNGYHFFWDWDLQCSYALFTNKKVYSFEVARGNDYIVGSRGLSKWVKDCSENPNVKDYDAPTKI